MKFDEARESLKLRLADYVKGKTKKSGSNYDCPIPGCNSGKGKNKTGAFSIAPNGKHWKCFSCGASGDLFDLIGALEGISGHGEQVRRAAVIFGVDINDSKEFGETTGAEQVSAKPAEEKTAPADYSAFFEEAKKHIRETDYWRRRGLSLETVERFNLGFCAEWKHPSLLPNEKIPTSPRLIIPTSKESYLARDTRENDKLGEAEKKYTKSKAGKAHIFNADALEKAEKPVYVVEGEIDALSIIEAGGIAVAMGSANYDRIFLDEVKMRRPKQPLIIALDNDDKGQDGAEKVKAGLKQAGFFYYSFSPIGESKDANEALCKNREALIEAVRQGEEQAKAQQVAAREEYGQASDAPKILAFLNGIDSGINTPLTPTGFWKLDKALDGGLYEGLYIIGAISSLGKTTFIKQIADNIAAQGKDVLYFSLEMAQTQLMAKSISRHTFELVMGKENELWKAKTTRGITAKQRYANYSMEQRAHIQAACEEYYKYAGHIFTFEGVGNIGAAQIRADVERHIRITGEEPVVFVDYLQILAAESDRLDDKQNADRAVVALKQMSRDFKLPVVVVSSFNRENYRTKVSFSAFKESGGIEYSSDVLLGLQYAGAGETNFNALEEAKKEPRNVELVILKSREGEVGARIKYSYYPKFNYFYEVERVD